MSVYTPVDQDSLNAFLAHYQVGALVAYEGISAGIENTNYFVDTDGGRWVLTLFECLQANELDYYLELMAWLAEKGIPTAAPQRNDQGDFLGTLCGKPATLVKRLHGSSVSKPDERHCRAIGEALANLHLAGQDFPRKRLDERGADWWKQTVARVRPHLDTEQQALADEELRFQGLYARSNLPQGTIHADLFHDNALFSDHRLSGLIDFYYACYDALLYDIAVTVNDWCSLDSGELDGPRVRVLLAAYHAIRPLSALEKGAWPVALRAAAMRFWLSRLTDQHFPRDGEITHIKDPGVFQRILQQRIAHTDSLRQHWPE